MGDLQGCVLTDTHCHLDFPIFDEDRDQVIERAREVGLIRLLNPSIDIETSEAAIRLVEKYSEVYAAIGVHPNSAVTWDNQTLNILRKLAQHPKVKAIGEIGLDYYRNHASPELQRRIFRFQLELAAEIGLPVIVHNRDASEDILRILGEWRKTLEETNSGLEGRPGVLHSFSGDGLIAQRAVDLEFFIGIGGPVTFHNAPALQQVVSGLQLDKMLIETDSPFLAPQPSRGKRNEPAFVSLVAGKIAGLHSQLPGRVAEITTCNADRLFMWR